jgi:hypothetical protein
MPLHDPHGVDGDAEKLRKFSLIEAEQRARRPQLVSGKNHARPFGYCNHVGLWLL